MKTARPKMMSRRPRALFLPNATLIPEIDLGEVETDIVEIINRALKKLGRPRVASARKSIEEILEGPCSAVSDVREVLVELVRLKYHFATIPRMRDALKQIELVLGRDASSRNASKASAVLATSSNEPPWPQIKSEFTGGLPFSRGLARDGDPDLEDLWDNRFAPEILARLVEQRDFGEFNRRREEVIPAVRALQEAISGTRPQMVPETIFVETLAVLWLSWGLPFHIGRGESTVPQGDFPDLVEAVRKAYPIDAIKEAHPDMPLEMQLSHIPSIVRTVGERFRRVKRITDRFAKRCGFA